MIKKHHMIKKHIGHIIPDLQIHDAPAPYPVLNERAIRATAGLMFAIGISTLWYTVLAHDRSALNVVVPLFWLHFLISSLRGPRFSPVARLGKLFVRGQRPEYVGAIQKRFARGIGLGMATLMMIVSFGFNIRGRGPLTICGICLLFMRLESAVGLCVWCKIYYRLIRKNIIAEPEHRPACPGGVCKIPQRTNG